MIRPVLLLTLLASGPALAAGGGDAPRPSETTKTCTDGKVWDKSTKSCVTASLETLDDDTLYAAVREFSHAGQYDNAFAALALMSDQSDDRVLTYQGFLHRKTGDVATGMAFYRRALAQNPANILARSYMGQALVEQGDLVAARAELDAIRDHGGGETWAYASLLTAISTGTTYNY